MLPVSEWSSELDSIESAVMVSEKGNVNNSSLSNRLALIGWWCAPYVNDPMVRTSRTLIP